MISLSDSSGFIILLLFTSLNVYFLIKIDAVVTKKLEEWSEYLSERKNK